MVTDALNRRVSSSSRLWVEDQQQVPFESLVEMQNPRSHPRPGRFVSPPVLSKHALKLEKNCPQTGVSQISGRGQTLPSSGLGLRGPCRRRDKPSFCPRCVPADTEGGGRRGVDCVPKKLCLQSHRDFGPRAAVRCPALEHRGPRAWLTGLCRQQQGNGSVSRISQDRGLQCAHLGVAGGHLLEGPQRRRAQDPAEGQEGPGPVPASQAAAGPLTIFSHR